MKNFFKTTWCSRIIKVIILIIFLISVIFYIVIKGETKSIGFESGKETSALSEKEKIQIITEFPTYSSRGIEQAYLTLPEWYMVYSYNEFGDFLHSGGKQTDFPFLKSIKNFWGYYKISLVESREQKFNWEYNFVSLMIGANYTVEYLIKSFYENTVGNITQFLSGSDTEADLFIANSWNNYSEKMYQTTWYHYPYFTDLKGIWTKTSLFDKSFIRNLERKSAFTFSYLIKGTYAKLWLLTATQKENQTLSVVSVPKDFDVDQGGVKILKSLDGNRYLIETERYAGFKSIVSKLLDQDVRFLEIMGHDIIVLSYLVRQSSELPFDSKSAVVIDRRELFFNQDGYMYRMTIKAKVKVLGEIIDNINKSNSKFEMIYDF